MSGTERPLGRSGVSVPALGVGTNRWNTGEPGQARLNETLAAAVDVEMGFFDTAEVYGFGRSERAVGAAARQDGRPIVLASKFAPLPARLAPPSSTRPWIGRWSGSVGGHSTSTTCTSPTHSAASTRG